MKGIYKNKVVREFKLGNYLCGLCFEKLELSYSDVLDLCQAIKSDPDKCACYLESSLATRFVPPLIEG